jgi:branched-chain amino acid transport system substrate-binding protein
MLSPIYTEVKKMQTRRYLASLAAAAIIAAAGSSPTAVWASDKNIIIGINLPLTGGDAAGAKRILNGTLLAISLANQSKLIRGYQLKPLILNDATPTAGQYDPAQAATNAREMVSSAKVLAAIGPQMSGSAKAMVPILSQGNLAMITPEATNPDLTDPQFAPQYRPAGKTVFFRTVTTDAYQGPNMANFFAERLNAKSIYILDDSGAYGVGIADTFQKQAVAKGMKVLGRDRIDPTAADYSAVLTKIKSLGAQALYYGGVAQAGVKLVKQAYDIIPSIPKGAGDGMYTPDVLSGAGFPAAEGWYISNASPHLTDDVKLANWVATYRARFGEEPDDYSITAFDGVQVIVAALQKAIGHGETPNRESVRAAIAEQTVPTLQGAVSFDKNGDITQHVVSVFRITHDSKHSDDDLQHQFAFIGNAPQS